MKKEVIYIDVEDDLTSIIEKIKAAKSSIVALVPPRRLGVLQSVVNLKLLKRAADDVSRKVVLITSDQALINLTAGLGIPVARNLQSRPEVVPENPEDQDETEVIEGKAMDEKSVAAPAAAKAADKPAKAAKPVRPGKKFKVPDFNKFRKKIILIVILVIALIGFGVWAIVYAPKATVTISAIADKIDVTTPVTIDAEAAETNASERVIKAESQQVQQNLTENFTATGKKDVGEKASGEITIRNCDYSDGFTLRAGAQFVADNGRTFVSTESVSVPKFSGSASSCSLSGSSSGKATVSVEASEIGDEYNVRNQSYDMPGITGKVDAVGTRMSGGSKRQVTVVTQGDIDGARQRIEQANHDNVKQQLIDQFGNNVRVFEESFRVELGQSNAQPGVDQEANEGTLTVPATFSMLGAPNDDISEVLSAYLERDIDDSTQQKVYDNGYEDLEYTVSDQPSPQRLTLDAKTTGYIGPNIDTEKLKEEIVGMRYGEIEEKIKRTPGVEEVHVDFSPFWVTTIPKVERVTIDLEVANEE